MMRRSLEDMAHRELVRKLDAEFSKWVRTMASIEGTCQCVTCKKRKPAKHMDAGHYISRRHMATRWNEMNVWPQCKQCNGFGGGEPQAYREFLVEHYSEEEVLELEQKRHTVVQWTKDELIQAINDYRSKLKALT